MRTDFFLPQRWRRAGRFCDRPLDQRVNAETGDPLTPDIEEHRQVVAPGKLKSTDGIYGIRFAHNTEGFVTGLTVTKP